MSMTPIDRQLKALEESALREPRTTEAPGLRAFQRMLPAANGHFEGEATRRVVAVRASSIAPLETQYTIYPYIARGEATWIEGCTKSGKTMALLDVAARMTRGDTFATGEQLESGRVAILTCEDDPARTIVPRLIAAHAELDAVDLIRIEDDNAPGSQLSFAIDLEGVERRLKADRIALLIVDGTFGFLRVADASSYSEAYAVMVPFVEMIRRSDVGCAIVRHVRKAEAAALHRGIGSVGFASLARSTVSVAVDRDDDSGNRRLWAHAGSNVGEIGQTLAFSIEGVSIDGFERTVGRVVWGGAVDVSADYIMASSRGIEDSADRDVAEEFLRSLLDGPMPAKDVFAAADRAKVPRRTLQRAAKRVGVQIERRGFGEGSLWVPPSEADEQAIRAKNHHSRQEETRGANGREWENVARMESDTSAVVEPFCDLEEALNRGERCYFHVGASNEPCRSCGGTLESHYAA